MSDKDPWAEFNIQPATQADPWAEFNLQPSQQPAASGFMPWLNRGIAETLGAPVDLVAAGMRAAGIPATDPVLGSGTFKRGMEAIGVNLPPEGANPQSPLEYMGRGTGNAAGFLPMGLGLAGMLQHATKFTPYFNMSPTVRGVAQQLTAAPMRMAPIDLAAGAGGGLGRYAGEAQTPDNPELGGMVGELLGGVATGGLAAVPSMVGKAASYMPGINAALGIGRQMAGAVLPGTQASNFARAGARLRGLVPDPQEAASMATRESIAPLTPAQRTGDERLLALERAVADRDPVLAEQLRTRAQQSQGVLESEMRGLGGQSGNARAFLEDRRAKLLDGLQARVDRARQTAQQRIAALEPNAPQGQQSAIVRQEFDAAYRDAMAEEGRLWRSVPSDVEIPTQGLREAYRTLVAETPETQRHNIPNYVREFLDPASNRALPETAPAAELQGFRSELMTIEWQNRREGNRDAARIAKRMADATLDAMGSLPEASAAYQVARDYSHQLNKTFREGEVGRLTEFVDRTTRVAPELTLQATVGQGGQRGAIAAREIEAALGARAQSAMPRVEDFLRGDLASKTITARGDVRPDTVARLLRQEEALLGQFPRLREDMVAALRAQTSARNAEQMATRVTRDVNTPSRSSIARYLSGDVGDEVAKVFNAQNPAQMASTLRQQVRKSDDAVAGLKGAFVDHIIGDARGRTLDGGVLNGSVVRSYLDNPQKRAALEAIFSPEEIERLHLIARELTALERARGPLPNVGAPMNDAPGAILDTLVRVAGARIGAAAGGHSMAGGLQSAQIMSSRARQFLSRLTNDRAAVLLSQSITDPELFATLMNPGGKYTQAQQVARLQAWLVGPGTRHFGDSEERDNGVRMGELLLTPPEE